MLNSECGHSAGISSHHNTRLRHVVLGSIDLVSSQAPSPPNNWIRFPDSFFRLRHNTDERPQDIIPKGVRTEKPSNTTGHTHPTLGKIVTRN